MQYLEKRFRCSDHLLEACGSELREINDVVRQVTWMPEFEVEHTGALLRHQRAYRVAIRTALESQGWELDVQVCPRPPLAVDARKRMVCVQLEFGNSASVYKDCFKLSYSCVHGLSSLAVLVVPQVPAEFFPTRASSVANMSSFDLADSCLQVLAVGFPAIVIGLQPDSSRVKTLGSVLREREAPIAEPAVEVAASGFPFAVGRTYKRQRDIHDIFGGNRQSGIAVCASHPYIFLFTSSSGHEFGYEDGFQDDGSLMYAGEGQEGDMRFTRGNKAIRDHRAMGKELHVFEKAGGGLHRYLGQFRYREYRTGAGPDRTGSPRRTIEFVLERVKP